jgi:hypothetical protein
MDVKHSSNVLWIKPLIRSAPMPTIELDAADEI